MTKFETKLCTKSKREGKFMLNKSSQRKFMLNDIYIGVFLAQMIQDNFC